MATDDDIALARALERGEAPDGGFPHARHLRVGWVYLSEAPSTDEAIARMSSTLRRFAASVGRAEKYSESITVFWMHQLAAVRAVMPDADVDAALRAYPRLLDTHLILAEDPNHAAATRSADPSGDAPDRPVSRRTA